MSTGIYDEFPVRSSGYHHARTFDSKGVSVESQLQKQYLHAVPGAPRHSPIRAHVIKTHAPGAVALATPGLLLRGIPIAPHLAASAATNPEVVVKDVKTTGLSASVLLEAQKVLRRRHRRAVARIVVDQWKRFAWEAIAGVQARRFHRYLLLKHAFQALKSHSAKLQFFKHANIKAATHRRLTLLSGAFCRLRAWPTWRREQTRWLLSSALKQLAAYAAHRRAKWRKDTRALCYWHLSMLFRYFWHWRRGYAAAAARREATARALLFWGRGVQHRVLHAWRRWSLHRRERVEAGRVAHAAHSWRLREKAMRAWHGHVWRRMLRASWEASALESRRRASLARVLAAWFRWARARACKRERRNRALAIARSQRHARVISAALHSWSYFWLQRHAMGKAKAAALRHWAFRQVSRAWGAWRAWQGERRANARIAAEISARLSVSVVTSDPSLNLPAPSADGGVPSLGDARTSSVAPHDGGDGGVDVSPPAFSALYVGTVLDRWRYAADDRLLRYSGKEAAGAGARGQGESGRGGLAGGAQEGGMGGSESGLERGTDVESGTGWWHGARAQLAVIEAGDGAALQEVDVASHQLAGVDADYHQGEPLSDDATYRQHGAALSARDGHHDGAVDASACQVATNACFISRDGDVMRQASGQEASHDLSLATGCASGLSSAAVAAMVAAPAAGPGAADPGSGGHADSGHADGGHVMGGRADGRGGEGDVGGGGCSGDDHDDDDDDGDEDEMDNGPAHGGRRTSAPHVQVGGRPGRVRSPPGRGEVEQAAVKSRALHVLPVVAHGSLGKPEVAGMLSLGSEVAGEGEVSAGKSSAKGLERGEYGAGGRNGLIWGQGNSAVPENGRQRSARFSQGGQAWGIDGTWPVTARGGSYVLPNKAAPVAGARVFRGPPGGRNASVSGVLKARVIKGWWRAVERTRAREVARRRAARHRYLRTLRACWAGWETWVVRRAEGLARAHVAYAFFRARRLRWAVAAWASFCERMSQKRQAWERAEASCRMRQLKRAVVPMKAGVAVLRARRRTLERATQHASLHLLRRCFRAWLLFLARRLAAKEERAGRVRAARRALAGPFCRRMMSAWQDAACQRALRRVQRERAQRHFFGVGARKYLLALAANAERRRMAARRALRAHRHACATTLRRAWVSWAVFHVRSGIKKEARRGAIAQWALWRQSLGLKALVWYAATRRQKRADMECAIQGVYRPRLLRQGVEKWLSVGLWRQGLRRRAAVERQMAATAAALARAAPYAQRWRHNVLARRRGRDTGWMDSSGRGRRAGFGMTWAGEADLATSRVGRRGAGGAPWPWREELRSRDFGSHGFGSHGFGSHGFGCLWPSSGSELYGYRPEHSSVPGESHAAGQGLDARAEPGLGSRTVESGRYRGGGGLVKPGFLVGDGPLLGGNRGGGQRGSDSAASVNDGFARGPLSEARRHAGEGGWVRGEAIMTGALVTAASISTASLVHSGGAAPLSQAGGAVGLAACYADTSFIRHAPGSWAGPSRGPGAPWATGLEQAGSLEGGEGDRGQQKVMYGNTTTGKRDGAANVGVGASAGGGVDTVAAPAVAMAAASARPSLVEERLALGARSELTERPTSGSERGPSGSVDAEPGASQAPAVTYHYTDATGTAGPARMPAANAWQPSPHVTTAGLPGPFPRTRVRPPPRYSSVLLEMGDDSHGWTGATAAANASIGTAGFRGVTVASSSRPLPSPSYHLPSSSHPVLPPYQGGGGYWVKNPGAVRGADAGIEAGGPMAGLRVPEVAATSTQLPQSVPVQLAPHETALDRIGQGQGHGPAPIGLAGMQPFGVTVQPAGVDNRNNPNLEGAVAGQATEQAARVPSWGHLEASASAHPDQVGLGDMGDRTRLIAEGTWAGVPWPPVTTVGREQPVGSEQVARARGEGMDSAGTAGRRGGPMDGTRVHSTGVASQVSLAMAGGGTMGRMVPVTGSAGPGGVSLPAGSGIIPLVSAARQMMHPPLVGRGRGGEGGAASQRLPAPMDHARDPGDAHAGHREGQAREASRGDARGSLPPTGAGADAGPRVQASTAMAPRGSSRIAASSGAWEMAQSDASARGTDRGMEAELEAMERSLRDFESLKRELAAAQRDLAALSGASISAEVAVVNRSVDASASRSAVDASNEHAAGPSGGWSEPPSRGDPVGAASSGMGEAASSGMMDEQGMRGMGGYGGGEKRQEVARQAEDLAARVAALSARCRLQLPRVREYAQRIQELRAAMPAVTLGR
eukprot:jgi/Mesvir1/20881/Mv07959-RA.1